MCAAFEADYVAARKLRNEELEVLEEVKKIIDEKLGDGADMSERVRERGTEDAAEWDDYVNPYHLPVE